MNQPLEETEVLRFLHPAHRKTALIGIFRFSDNRFRFNILGWPSEEAFIHPTQDQHANGDGLITFAGKVRVRVVCATAQKGANHSGGHHRRVAKLASTPASAT